MELFFIGLVMLIVGYFTYGTFVEKILSPDSRKTPAVANNDGVDYLVLPHWKNMLIQLLNIAGVGPVIGVILGIKFGSIVFIIIPLGNIIAGATHDMLSGMMSLRNNGSNLTTMVRKYLGSGYSKAFYVFTVVLLLLVVAVFINVPASLIAGELKTGALGGNFESIDKSIIFWISVGLIFVYYVFATLFPVDKIIGRFYPLFGLMLLIGTAAIFISICCGLVSNPDLLTETETFKEMMWTSANNHPIIPLLFVTIACGIISGFHATQSPIVARTIKSEKNAKQTFYGMMVIEGIIGMIWAAAGLAIYNLFPEHFTTPPAGVLVISTKYFLGDWMGMITIIAVIILAVTSGDTALRSLRLSCAEMMGIQQKSLIKRLAITIPLCALVAAILAWSQIDANSFANLWNYFAWGNQVLAVSTLMAASVWLFRQGKNGYIALIPACFMSFIVFSYIIWISPEHGGPWGFGLDLNSAYLIAIILTALFAAWVYRRGKR